MLSWEATYAMTPTGTLTGKVEKGSQEHDACRSEPQSRDDCDSHDAIVWYRVYTFSEGGTEILHLLAFENALGHLAQVCTHESKRKHGART